MVRYTVEVIVTGFALLFGCYVIPGIFIRGDFFTAVLACIILALANASQGLLSRALNLSMSAIMAGLVSFLIGVFMVLLLSFLMPGFVVSGFFSAVLFAVLLGLFKMLFHAEPARA